MYAPQLRQDALMCMPLFGLPDSLGTVRRPHLEHFSNNMLIGTRNGLLTGVVRFYRFLRQTEDGGGGESYLRFTIAGWLLMSSSVTRALPRRYFPTHSRAAFTTLTSASPVASRLIE